MIDKVIPILICILLWGGYVQAGDWTKEKGDWTKEDTLRQAAYSVVHIADWGQSVWVAKHDDYEERNPILKDSAPNDVHLYFATTLIGHAAISYMLPPTPRKYWQYIWFGIEAINVNNNLNAGVKFSY